MGGAEVLAEEEEGVRGWGMESMTSHQQQGHQQWEGQGGKEEREGAWGLEVGGV